METKKLVDYIDDGAKEAFVASSMANAVLVEPSFGDFMTWQSTAIASIKQPEKAVEAYWLAVNASVRQENGKTKQFLTHDDYQRGKARLHKAVGEAANKFLIEYTTEGDEKKAN